MRPQLRPLRFILPCLFAATSFAQQPLRIWGDTDMGAILTVWEAAYQQQHPGTRFENHLLGTDTGIPALYGGLADIALLGREPNQTEHDGFLHSTQYEPLRIALTHGALDAPGHSYAPVVFVAKDNPLQHLTFAELAFAFGSDGTRPPARTWGDLGLTGAWKDRPLHLYTFDMESGSGTFLLAKLQGPSKKMNWPAIREFHDLEHPDGSLYAAGEQTMDTLLADPNGLAVSGLRYATDRVKPLALAASTTGTFIAPTRVTISDATYPLTRTTYAVADQSPGKQLNPAVSNFLRWLLTPEAQKLLLTQQPSFLPLSPPDASKEAAKLD